MTIRKKILISTLALALLSAGPASAQSASDSARLKRLENEIETLSRMVYRGETPPAGASMAGETGGNAAIANFELRLNQIEATLRDLTGRIEEQGHADRQIQERLDRVLGELDRRMMDVEAQVRGGTQTAPVLTGNNAYPAPGYADAPVPPPASPPQAGTETPGWASTPQPLDAGDIPPIMSGDAPATNAPTGQLGTLTNNAVTGAPALPLAGDSPAAHYEQAFALLRARDYEAAGNAFADFLERHPRHELAANAKYWLGESWYVRNNFERAARIFAEAYQDNTKGPKAPDNLLKLALSLNGMGKKAEACLSLSQLKKEYGAINSPVTARADQESTRLGCKS